jgi:AcrR family transcriptional regulator
VPKRTQGRPANAESGVGRDALIDSSRRLLQVKPPGKVTREEIARFAGVNPALIRYYFGDKSTPLTAVVEAISQENLKRLRETLSQGGTAADRLARRVIYFFRCTPRILTIRNRSTFWRPDTNHPARCFRTAYRPGTSLAVYALAALRVPRERAGRPIRASADQPNVPEVRPAERGKSGQFVADSVQCVERANHHRRQLLVEQRM